MMKQKKRLLAVLAVFSLVAVVVAIFAVRYYNETYMREFPLFTPSVTGKIIPLPGLCKIGKRGGDGIVKFTTKKSVEEVIRFYEEYLKECKRVTSPYTDEVGYLVESGDFVLIQYSAAFSNGKTWITLSYDAYSTVWKEVVPNS